MGILGSGSLVVQSKLMSPLEWLTPFLAPDWHSIWAFLLLQNYRLITIKSPFSKRKSATITSIFAPSGFLTISNFAPQRAENCAWNNCSNENKSEVNFSLNSSSFWRIEDFAGIFLEIPEAFERSFSYKISEKFRKIGTVSLSPIFVLQIHPSPSPAQKTNQQRLFRVQGETKTLFLNLNISNPLLN